mmetsp:Transcript_60749/g.170213  ORF Transcript_60749/g.170213 Transcript_60749/m.170213 type:complete len:410 (-) Transcript_60749:180-1409(-)
MLAALRPEHGVRAKDVASGRKQGQHRLLRVHLRRAHVHDERLLHSAADALKLRRDGLHRALEGEDARRDDQDIQALLQKFLQRGTPDNAHRAGFGSIAAPGIGVDLERVHELLRHELAERAEAIDAYFPVLADQGGGHGRVGAQILQAGQDTTSGVGAQDAEERRDLLQVLQGVGRHGLVGTRKEVEVEDVSVMRTALRTLLLPRRLNGRGLADEGAGCGHVAAHAPIEALEAVHDVGLARPALDLREVDVSQGEDGEGLEEGAGGVVKGDGDGGLALEALHRMHGLPPEQEKARVVIRVVLNAPVQHLQAIGLRRQLAADRRDTLQISVLDELGAPGSVVRCLLLDPRPGDVGVALGEGLRVADDLLEVLLLCPWEGEQGVPHAKVVLGDDEQAMEDLQVAIRMDRTA